MLMRDRKPVEMLQKENTYTLKTKIGYVWGDGHSALLIRGRDGYSALLIRGRHQGVE